MNKKHFYVKSYSDNSTYELDIDNINALALFAISLEPEPAMSEAEKYSNALAKYCKDYNSGLSICYKKLNSDIYGQHFLLATINLFLLEKKFRKDGIFDMKLITQYNRIVVEYNKQLETNNNKYNDLYFKNKNYYKK